ncbi:hypothetical protein I3760_13G036900 [Carya illinoinensis]|nr:hypothetical protein I3760_13G036900 [Carya illinoinensis]KAG2672368.1 hypothetical protein I3760_13G036900 [Carya illinoinensis]
MQSRKHEDYSTIAPDSKFRAQHRSRMGADPCNGTLRDRSPLTRQNLSPHELDGSRRVGGASRRSGSAERGDYAWHLGGVSGGRRDRMRSRSPPFEQVKRRAQFDEGGIGMRRDYALPIELQRRYELADRTDDKVGDDSLTPANIYGYQHYSSRTGKEKDFDESRLSEAGGRRILGQKSMAMEDGMPRGSYRLPQDRGPTSNYGETGGHLSSSSQRIDIRQIEHERLLYRDPLAVDKLTIMESSKDGEKPMFQSRDVPYLVGSASHSKDSARTFPLKDLSISSSRMLRGEFLGSYEDDIHLPPPDEFSRGGRNLKDPIGRNMYGRSPLIESPGHHEAGHRNLTYCQRGAYSPTRVKCEDHSYPKLRATANDDREHPPDDLYRAIPPRAPLDYDLAQINYDHRDFSSPSNMHPIVNRAHDNSDDSYGNPHKGIILDHPTIPKHAGLDYLDMNRTSNTSTQGGEYLGSGCNDVDFGRRVSEHHESAHLSASQDHHLIHLRSDYAFGKDAGPKFLKERLQSPPISKYDSDMHRHSVRMQRMEEELGFCEPLDRVFKRKYSADEELGGHDSRRFMSKWNATGERQDLYDRGEEWIDDDTSGLYSSNVVGFDRNEYRKSKRIYDRLERHQDFTSDEWLSSQDFLAHTQRHSVRLYKNGGQFTRCHPRNGSFSSNNSHNLDRRSGFHKHPKVWKSNDDYYEDVQEDYGNPSEDWASPSESEPAEDSEKFKQLVHEAFLKFSKKLNVNPAVRRRYKEQGKGGSLFCIACGRSLSKEFMDTQRLVRHAFMSHKVGLRAQHLGLHKAICVLLGWNTVAPHDTITWVPQVLPNAEALAQKEDLILWPPVIIIHNISMSDNNPGKWKVITMDEIEALLRRKGFVRGRIKVCLGRPSDQSVMVVKFLGTFTGMGDAERLHKYYAENKRGRIDFGQLALNNGKSSNSWDAGMQGDKAEEHVLYGYMGIAEDLDKVDIYTRKTNLIKSKKEIQDLANAPLRPEER